MCLCNGLCPAITTHLQLNFLLVFLGNDMNTREGQTECTKLNGDKKSNEKHFVFFLHITVFRSTEFDASSCVCNASSQLLLYGL